jgi:hypothetical protein
LEPKPEDVSGAACDAAIAVLGQPSTAAVKAAATTSDTFM